MSKYLKQLLILALALGYNHASFCPEMRDLTMEHARQTDNNIDRQFAEDRELQEHLDVINTIKSKKKKVSRDTRNLKNRTTAVKTLTGVDLSDPDNNPNDAIRALNKKHTEEIRTLQKKQSLERQQTQQSQSDLASTFTDEVTDSGDYDFNRGHENAYTLLTTEIKSKFRGDHYWHDTLTEQKIDDAISDITKFMDRFKGEKFSSDYLNGFKQGLQNTKAELIEQEKERGRKLVDLNFTKIESTKDAQEFLGIEENPPFTRKQIENKYEFVKNKLDEQFKTLGNTGIIHFNEMIKTLYDLLDQAKEKLLKDAISSESDDENENANVLDDHNQKDNIQETLDHQKNIVTVHNAIKSAARDNDASNTNDNAHKNELVISRSTVSMLATVDPEAANEAQQHLDTASDEVTNKRPGWQERFAVAMKKIWEIIQKALKDLWTKIDNLATRINNVTRQDVKDVLVKEYNDMRTKYDTLKESARTFAEATSNRVKTTLDNAIKVTTEKLKTAQSKLQDLANKFDKATGPARVAIKQQYDKADAAVTELRKQLDTQIEKGAKWARDQYESAKQNLSDKVNEAQKKYDELRKNMPSFGQARQAFLEKMNAARDNLIKAKNNLNDFATSILAKIKMKLDGIKVKIQSLRAELARAMRPEEQAQVAANLDEQEMTEEHLYEQFAEAEPQLAIEAKPQPATEAKPQPEETQKEQEEKGEKRAKDENKGKTPAQILGVDENAKEKEINKAYHEKALKYHPDKSANATTEDKAYIEEMMKAVNNARDSLKAQLRQR